MKFDLQSTLDRKKREVEIMKDFYESVLGNRVDIYDEPVGDRDGLYIVFLEFFHDDHNIPTYDDGIRDFVYDFINDEINHSQVRVKSPHDVVIEEHTDESILVGVKVQVDLDQKSLSTKGGYKVTGQEIVQAWIKAKKSYLETGDESEMVAVLEAVRSELRDILDNIGEKIEEVETIAGWSEKLFYFTHDGVLAITYDFQNSGLDKQPDTNQSAEMIDTIEESVNWMNDNNVDLISLLDTVITYIKRLKEEEI